MVIVDWSIVFVGGIDFCYGWWDICYYELMDNFNIYFVVDENYVFEFKFEGFIEWKYVWWIGKDYRNIFYNKEN